MDSGNESTLAIQQNLKTAAEGDVKEYIVQVITSLFGLSPRDQTTLDVELSSTVSYLTDFINEADKNVLVVDRVVAREQGDQPAAAESGGEESVPATFQVHDGLFVADRGQAMVFVKQSNVIEADKKIASQVSAFPLNGGSAWEQLHFVMSRILNPYCKSFISQSGRGERDGDKLAPTVQKCFTEAEAALLHLQQNIDIPEINLVINQSILDAIEKAGKENRRAKIEDLGDIVEDTNFLNALQAGCNRWVKEIRKVTQLERDPSSGTSLQEMTFWLNLERALLKIAQKRDGEEVTLTLEALKCGKRFHATVGFDSDTGLKQKLAVVQDYNTLMKDFPLSDLVSATDVPKLMHAVTGIFLHLRKLRSTKYPLQRALRLVEAISRDLNSQLLKVLSSYSLMHAPIAEFNDILSQCQSLFSKWDDEYDKFIALLRDINKKKRDDPSKLSWKVTAVHKRLEQRLGQILQFRKQHEQFRTVIERVLRPVGNASSRTKEEFMVDSTEGEKSPDEQVDIAYEFLKNVDFLDVDSPAWENAYKRYEDQIGVVETAITTRLKGQLESSRNSNEMFSIFSRYNALFIRPRIRGAIYEYQTRLINRVKDDINKLQERFTKARGEQGVKIMQTAGLPPFSAKIMWIRNFERQLQRYMKRVEDVLGKQWENHVDGRQLKADGDNFKVKLNTQPMFEEWVETVQSQNWILPTKILTVDRAQIDGKMQLQLKVNYNLDSLVLYKEVSHLKTMGFRVPLKIVNWAHQANQMHPSATSLIEATRTFASVNAALASVQGVDSLLASYKRDIQVQLLEGATLGWDSYKVDQYQLRLAETVNTYQERCEELLNVVRIVNADLNVLKSCRYDKETIENLLSSIQKGVDQLSLGNYSNLAQWVNTLDQQIETILARRVEDAIRVWTLVFSQSEEVEELRERQIVLPHVKNVVVELFMTAQTLYISPSIRETREKILEQLYEWHSVCTAQTRISGKRFQMVMNEEIEPETYHNILNVMPEGQACLEKAYDCVNGIMSDLEEYLSEWLSYQSLWVLQADQLFEMLGTSLSKWMKTLMEIRKGRLVFDTQDTRRAIFPVSVEYGKAQQKILFKYDYWHKEMLVKFGAVVGDEMQKFYNSVSKWRNVLETQSVDGGSTSDTIGLISFVQSLKKQTKAGQDAVDLYRSSQRLLNQQRYQFPAQWLYSENVEGEWSAFAEILSLRDASIQTQMMNLQTKFAQEDEIVEKRTGETLAEWNKNKPVEGSQRPQDALNVITAYEAKLNKLTEERNKMRKARVALDLSDSAHAPSERDKLSVATEELSAMKDVWKALQPVYTGIDESKEKTWLSVQPRKIRQSLDELMNQLKQLPVKCRTYQSYEHVKTMLHTYGKMNQLVAELKSEALKERHWHQMMKEMRVNWNLTDLTLGQVWDADILRHEHTIRKILTVAQGEMALEEFLREMREYWQNYEVELVNYQNKTRLIKGWDDLFNKLKEHQNSLSAMKLSPYYKQFEESAQSWDEKLNKINAMFDVWIDVQRRWVYLEGLFSGSAEIATLLPFESSRFATITTDVLALMKKVAASPRILDVVNMQGAQRLLERLADMLAKIQKALGEYLERERSSFPRFYFVGDEDLLEIMGNSKDITRIQKHLKKMFAGITAIDINEEDRSITAFHSREGENVNLVKKVTTKDVRINDWLQALESEMKHTLARQLASSLAHFSKMNIQTMTTEDYVQWLDNYPTQVITLTAEIWWCDEMEKTLADGKGAEVVEQLVVKTLELLADSVLKEQPPIRRKKMEALITELVHKRDTCRKLSFMKIRAANDFGWLQCMRFYFDPKEVDPIRCCVVKMANAQFYYGFEYLGIQERLVRTPLTDRCYLTMTQALHSRLGGSPFGPAGTGKTESVKALGHQLGRFVLVFNCDETFDFQAMGRILVGLCQVGAWGCFDEFNRLEERMLSAVSQQIQTIQEAVRAGGDMSVDLVGKRLNVNSNIGIFITMNPGYSGRSNLPDNLKQLFRSLAMTQPDRQLIAQVMLFSQGFRTAETLANKIVPLFILCKEQLSAQCHYDFGLRALKYVLVSAGNIKRDKLDKIGSAALEDIAEQQMLIQSVCETLVPKLVNEDIALLFSLLSDVFPGIHYTANQMTELRQQLSTVCQEHLLVFSDTQGEMGSMWLDKVLQLYQITNLNHGLMLVGSSGSGKTMAWKVLLKALERWENVEGVSHVIDAKAMSKDSLYGVMDQNTREWTDGLFTSIVRKIIDNVRGEADRRQWIIFDGDVDPEWVENLNSVLDDNKLLTLPNGERLSIPPNVRIIFEVADLKYATLATVSRCGMVWFSEEVVTSEMLFARYLSMLRGVPLDSDSAVSFSSSNAPVNLVKDNEPKPTRAIEIQRTAALAIQAHFSQDGIVPGALKYAVSELEHIMPPTPQRLLSSFFSMMSYSVRKMVSHDEGLIDDSMEIDQIQNFVLRSMLTNLVWAFSGDGKWKSREMMSDFIRQATTISLPPNQQACLIDYEVQLNGDWQPWLAKVPTMEIESHRVAAADLVVPTIDTVRHEMLLAAWLAEHKPLVLCGPPGSGKTMTLLAALRSQQEMDVVNVNFSSSTTPELLLRTFDHYCEYRRTPNGVVLAPVQLSQWLVIFCDEINLPSPDKYGTQRVISFLRQLVELNGFYRTSDHSWVSLERIQFVGACNPPTDPGRHPMTSRFLRHVPIVYVDYPGQTSLQQIYGTFNRAMLKMTPAVRGLADQLTNAMVDVYLASQEHFTQDDQPHYVYSPRELTRWVRGISEAITPLESLSADQLVRLWAHEAIRLFQDRLVTEEEREWTDKLVDTTAERYFGNSCRLDEALKRPLLYSCWLSRNYVPVTREELQDYVSARLKGFYEEELDVKLVLFDQMLDHVLRIDRIYRQSQGHLLLIGTAGAGKTTLSRFVAWLNGLSVFQLKVHSKYTAADFDEDMRTVLRRAGCRNEKLCFIMDESNMLDTGFLERLNTLLANGEVPGLFEGDEHTTLMTQIKEGAQRQGLILDSHDELYKWFTQQVMRNLHVVFTMNPSGSGLRERASTSPALFNRCVLNWFGDWSENALYQVGSELTRTMDLDRTDYEGSVRLTPSCELVPSEPTYRDAVVNTLCLVHKTVQKFNELETKKGHRVMACTPRHFLDFIKQFMAVFHEKRSDLEEEKIHLNIGLNKISETEEQVKELQKSLHLKRKELEEKKEAANLKLKEMLGDQQKAEEEKKFSEQLQKELAEQLKQMAEKKTFVESDLAQVEPAVAEAQTAVQGIKKSQLVEVKSMSSPPVTVKLTLEAICILLGEQVGTDWKAIRQVMMKEDFMTRILQFDTESLTPKILSQMEVYIQNPDWEFDKVNRASVACGPMVKWARAQLLYSTMLHKVEPLRNELKRLEKEAAKKTDEGKVVDVRITELEESIGKYKEEYAQLIGQAENIKQDLSSVQEKVNRSTQLLSSLRSERDRWSSGSAGFSQQMDSLVGDALLSSAFLAYAGYYDQMLRDEIFHKWFNHVVNAGLHFRHDLARIEYLSTVDDRLQWQLNSLPVDDLCTENAIMLHRFNRYPLIIDPSGQAVEYIMKQFAGKNIQKTSFLDESFRKNLESALRFGNSLLVQDVEAYDPILNPVLNREVKRAGGRVLITIGDQDIDLSPAFQIFMITRDSTVEFSPDICSRVTFVNFTVTSSSLASQCLNQVLRSERPDVDKKRNDLLKLQGEFAVRLRHLEKALLAALNESKGKILDDNSVIETLEKLKNEAAEVAQKSAETDKVMAEVDAVSAQYQRLATACSHIYHTLQQLNEIHFLYHYSLDFLVEIFTYVLKTPELTSTTDYAKRLRIITTSLFQTVFRRVSRGMLHTDKVLLALLLMRIHIRSNPAAAAYEKHFDLLLGRSDVAKNDDSDSSIPPGLDFLTMENKKAIAKTRKVQGFENVFAKLQSNSAAVTAWSTHDNPESNVPVIWDDADGKLTPLCIAMNSLIVVHALRPDRLMASAHRVVSTAFDDHFMQQDKVVDILSIVDNEVAPSEPVLLCSATGYDASGKIEDLAVETSRQLTSIAIGSAEGFNQADSALGAATKSGRWVLLKNVHLAPSWLAQLEKRLHSMKPHAQFRLFLTAEIHPKLPSSILRASRVVVFEPATGLKANLLRSLSSIPPQRLTKAPTERSRLYLLVCWLHALVQERLRYTPLGWSTAYEFSDADLRVACDTLDAAVDAVAQGRPNVEPERLPWTTLRTLLSQCIYGGKIDNQFDQVLLDCVLENLFTAKSFDQDHVLIPKYDGDESLFTPNMSKKDQMIGWVEELKNEQLPAWLGLPNNAEKVLLTKRGESMLRNMLKVTDEELAFSEDGKEEVKPQWMAQLGELAKQWLLLLPKEIVRMRRTVENIKDPLFRFFEREVNLGSQLLKDIRRDLNEIAAVCRAEKKQNNETRALAASLQKGEVPNGWKRYTVPKEVTVMEWMTDLNERLKQLMRVGGSDNLKRETFWLGGTFSPEAYITATRQQVAQANTWSLEQLSLHIHIGRTDNTDVFRISGVDIRGAKSVGGNKLELCELVKSECDVVEFSWKQEAPDGTRLPLYLYGDRRQLISPLSFQLSSATVFYQRGVALVANSTL